MATKLTVREYYDLLITSSLNGGFPAQNESGECLYRALDGKKCAIGLLIPDKHYDPTMERDSVSGLSERFKSWFDDYVPEGVTVKELMSLQYAHDNNIQNGKWSHVVFVEELHKIDCFKDFTPAEEVDKPLIVTGS